MIQINTIPSDSKIISIDKINTIPTCGGIYKFYSEENILLYIGKATNLQSRIYQHLGNSKNSNTKDIKHNFKKVSYILVDCPVDRDIYETYLINKLKPLLNREKVYTYKSSYSIDKYKSLEKLKEDLFLKDELSKVYLSLNL